MEESLTKAYAVLDQERARINNALDLNLKQMLAESAEMISIMKQSVNESLDHQREKLDRLAKVENDLEQKLAEFEALQQFFQMQMANVKAVFAGEWENDEERTTTSVGCVSEDTYNGH